MKRSMSFTMLFAVVAMFAVGCSDIRNVPPQFVGRLLTPTGWEDKLYFPGQVDIGMLDSYKRGNSLVLIQTSAFAVKEGFLGAQAMEVTPSPTSQTTDNAGLIYHRLDLGPETAEARPEVGFRYRKDTAALSVDTTGAAGPLATPPPARGTSVDVQGALPWLVLFVGLALIAGGVIYYLRTRVDERPSRPRHQPASQPEEKRSEVDASPVFCHNCGTQASASDRFCRRCGTALRT